mmetsp:Transcript_39205/g.71130  ORF Transcript_39205/g.71130 Transcript_39205/m.71130 type:complete len:575 (-) Transcript_39205:83-1807(-)
MPFADVLSFAAPSGLRPMSPPPAAGSSPSTPHLTAKEENVPQQLHHQQQLKQQQPQQQQRPECAALIPEELARAIADRLLPELRKAERLQQQLPEKTASELDGAKAMAEALSCRLQGLELLICELHNSNNNNSGLHVQAAAAQAAKELWSCTPPLQELEVLAPEASEQPLSTGRIASGGLCTRRSNSYSSCEAYTSELPRGGAGGKVKRVSSEVTSEKRFLRRAFVVNFRRLLEMQKVFAIIHEFIKSTAIAALTLVLASNVWELSYSVTFVAILFVIYGLHAAHYDTMDISDVRCLADLLVDDNAEISPGGRIIQNPNRLLKAMTLARTGRRRRKLLVIVGFSVLCLLVWSLVLSQWFGYLELSGIVADFMAGEFYATLLLVGTLMLLFHVTFEWLYWRETQCVMPFSVDGEPWDPQKHGVPRQYSWLGLPSMWLTSVEAYADLALWITQAKKCEGCAKISKIFPEEMAMLAMDASAGCQLRNALLHAKLYSAQKGCFLVRGAGKGQMRSLGKDFEEPEELGIDLLLFDSQRFEYLQPEDEHRPGQVHLLHHCATSGGGSECVSEARQKQRQI